ncbi:MAG: hypothetical protein HQL28_03675 [Candidatus Omnitrophica bacterium]|nr:hypothetical protein [Candidatus Omnitrophota bacterium]
MEPFSLFGIIVMSFAGGAILSMFTKGGKTQDKTVPTAADEKMENVIPEEKPAKKLRAVVDYEKEKEIEELLRQEESAAKKKKR